MPSMGFSSPEAERFRTEFFTVTSFDQLVKLTNAPGFGFDPRAELEAEARRKHAIGDGPSIVTEADVRRAVPVDPAVLKTRNVTQERKAVAWAKSVLTKRPRGFAPKIDLPPSASSNGGARDDDNDGGGGGSGHAHEIDADIESACTGHLARSIVAVLNGTADTVWSRQSRANASAFLSLIADGSISTAALDSAGGVAPVGWAATIKDRTAAAHRAASHPVAGGRGGDGDRVVETAIAIQALNCRRNTDARAAIDAGTFWDPAVMDHAAALACLRHSRARIDARVAECRAAFWTRQARLRAVANALATTMDDKIGGEWCFISAICAAFVDHCAEFHLLVDILCDGTINVPQRSAKVRLLILGKVDGGSDGLAYLNNGNVWIPDAALRRRFESVLGTGTFDDIMIEARGKITTYQYRGYPAHVPNRHGHGNGNPSDWAARGGVNL